MKTRKHLVAFVVLCLFMTVFVLFAVTASASAEDEQTEMMPLVVTRPKIILNAHKGTDKIKTLTFGTEVTLLSYEYDYCQVQDSEGDIGFVETGYLGYSYGMLWISNENKGVALAPVAGMNRSQFASAAGGRRMNEKAIILIADENSDYYYIVTEEGFSGYVLKYELDLMPYEYFLKLQEQEQQQEGNPEGNG